MSTPILSTASSRIWIDSENPSASEENIDQGNLWINTSTGSFYICDNPTVGAQVWSRYAIYSSQTFTPTVAGSSAAGTATYAKQLGKITKMNETTIVQLWLNWSASDGTGNMLIKGYPDTFPSDIPPRAIAYCQNITLPLLTVQSICKGVGSDIQILGTLDASTETAVGISAAGIITAYMVF